MKECPACKEHCITNMSILRSTLALGAEPKCTKCGRQFTVGGEWQGNIGALIFLSVVFSLVFSIVKRSYLPYLSIPISVIILSFIVISFAKLDAHKTNKLEKLKNIFFILFILIGLIALVSLITY